MNAIRPIALAAMSLCAAAAAHAATMNFSTPLGPEALGATGSGLVLAQYDATAHTLAIQASFAGLSGVTTVSHIHCCTSSAGAGTVGVAVTPGTLPGFPVGVKGAFYTTVLDLTLNGTYTAGFRGVDSAAGAEARLIQGMVDGKAYFNVHSNVFPGGEIRGFLHPVPEPETYALMAIGLLGVAAVARRRRAS